MYHHKKCQNLQIRDGDRGGTNSVGRGTGCPPCKDRSHVSIASKTIRPETRHSGEV